jgi:hypothetical protein
MREDVDPRIDKMIAFLYGELPPVEEAAFRRLLDADATLRSELEELSSARGLLAAWKVEEAVPSFVLVEGAAGRKAVARAPAGDGPVRRFFASLRGFATSPAWAFATAALALVVLAFAGFRVERVPGGVAFRVGGAPPPATPQRELPGVGTGQPLELGSRAGAPPGGSQVVPVSGSYLTHDEFNAYNSQLMTTLASLLNQYDERRDRETTELMQSLYRRINDQQLFDYERTNRRIDALGEQLLTGSGRTMDLDPRNPSSPSGPSSTAPRTGEE